MAQAQTIKNWELRANKFKYGLDELEKTLTIYALKF